MAQANVPFDKRLKRITRRHDRMGNGTVKTMTSDGLIVERPRMYKPRFPLKGLIVLLAIGFLFKGFMLSSLGEAGYAERVAGLSTGSVLEQGGAWVMQIDPATSYIAGKITELGF